MRGLRLVIDVNIQLHIIVQDLESVIDKFVSKSVVVDNSVDSMLDHDRKEVFKFSSINFFHVLKENNQVTCSFSNKATFLKESVISINKRNFSINKKNFDLPILSHINMRFSTT